MMCGLAVLFRQHPGVRVVSRDEKEISFLSDFYHHHHYYYHLHLLRRHLHPVTTTTIVVISSAPCVVSEAGLATRRVLPSPLQNLSSLSSGDYVTRNLRCIGFPLHKLQAKLEWLEPTRCSGRRLCLPPPALFPCTCNRKLAA